MSNLVDLLLLLVIVALVSGWLKLSRAREQALEEAERQCRRHGLQLLDDSIGLRSLRLRRLDGHWQFERGYEFEVSIDGDDREPGRLWLSGRQLTALRLPTIELSMPDSTADAAPPASLPSAGSNVIPLRPRLRDRDTHR